MRDPFANLLTTKELMVEAGCSRQTIQAHKAAGKITPDYQLEGPTGPCYWSKATAKQLRDSLVHNGNR